MAKCLKVDLHTHSSHSHDSRVSPEEIVKAAKEKGLDAVAITDHGTREGGLSASRGIKVLVGQEVKTKQGDLLVFNVDRDLEQNLSLMDTCRLARRLGGFIIIPHPFDSFRNATFSSKLKDQVDAIEGFNARCFFESSNRKAEALAKKLGIPAVASSDAHVKEDVGRAYTLVEGKDIFQGIAEGRVKMVKNRVGKALLLERRVKKIFKGI